jgi:hypothetical protein
MTSPPVNSRKTRPTTRLMRKNYETLLKVKMKSRSNVNSQRSIEKMVMKVAKKLMIFNAKAP